MKTMIKSILVQVPISIPVFNKLKGHFFIPLISGFWGFFATLMMISFVYLFSYVIGSNDTIAMDIIDFLAASIGFVLKMTVSLLKSFAR